MKVEGTKLEQVKSLTCLDIQIQNNRKQVTEINERISKTMKVNYVLNKKYLKW